MFKADASSVAKLGRALRKTQPDVHKAIRRAVLEEARKVRDDAKRRADWSTRIPATIKASAAGVNTAVVRAGGVNAPHAAAYEHAGREGTFRHPVFPDASKTRDEWTWVTEAARPFLLPAALERLDETAEQLGVAVTAAVDDAIRRA